MRMPNPFFELKKADVFPYFCFIEIFRGKMKKMAMIMLIICTCAQTHAQDTSLFLRYSFSSGNFKLPYRLLTPHVIEQDTGFYRYPLVIFLHGAGERGKDNSKQLMHGAKVFATAENLEKYPCFVLAPQCPENLKWVDTDWKLDKQIFPESPTLPMKVLMQLVDSFIKTHKVDTSRIYITGLSMGGFGTWDLACRMNKKVSAIVPVCGGGDEGKAPLLTSIPVWAFHGANDPLVKPFRSSNMVNAVNKAGGEAKLTMYENTGHDSWTKTYSDPEMLKWLFSQRRK